MLHWPCSGLIYKWTWMWVKDTLTSWKCKVVYNRYYLKLNYLNDLAHLNVTELKNLLQPPFGYIFTSKYCSIVVVLCCHNLGRLCTTDRTPTEITRQITNTQPAIQVPGQENWSGKIYLLPDLQEVKIFCIIPHLIFHPATKQPGPHDDLHTLSSFSALESVALERRLSSPCISPAITVGIAVTTGGVADSTRVAGSPIPADWRPGLPTN